MAKKRSRQARATSAKAALVATSPASVGLERRKLELKQNQERRKRIKEYKATLAIMKKRGVKAPRVAVTRAKQCDGPGHRVEAMPRYAGHVVGEQLNRNGRFARNRLHEVNLVERRQERIEFASRHRLSSRHFERCVRLVMPIVQAPIDRYSEKERPAS